MIPAGLVPLVVSLGSQYVAKYFAQRAAPSARAATYQRVLTACGWLAIVGSLIWSFVGLYTAEKPYDRGTGIYGMLGVDARASARQINRGFREFGSKVHPDKHPNKRGEYEALSAGYEILKSPQLKFLYDRFGEVAVVVFRQGAGHNIPYSHMFSDLFMLVASRWALTTCWIIVGSWLAGGPWLWHLTVLSVLATTDLTLVSRDWFEWYLPIPPFQVGTLLRNSVPAIVGGLNLLVPKLADPLDAELMLLRREALGAEILAKKRLETTIEPFVDDEQAMLRLRNAANRDL